MHAIHWAHLLVADKANYNSHSGGDMQTEQGHIEQAIVRGNVVSIVVWSTVLSAECVSRTPGLTPGCPEISCQHLFLRDLGRISNASPSTSQLCLPAPCGHSFLLAASGRQLSLYHGPYLGVDRRTPSSYIRSGSNYILSAVRTGWLHRYQHTYRRVNLNGLINIHTPANEST